MEIISAANKTILKILGKPQINGEKVRLLKYCVSEKIEVGVLLFNLLTRELLLLSDEEFENMQNVNYLKENWFLVKEDFEDKKCVDMVKWVTETTKKKSENITSYTILPTSDCNARCFYCFEKGEPRIPMSREIASKTVDYIIKHSGGEKIKITWFGGEPLYNLEIIDIISEKLKKSGVDFTSFMISNGYLFDDNVVKKAGDNWNLKGVQITLDGTEDVYNRTKAFIYRDVNPFNVVLSNIDRLINRGIYVVIRLNMDSHNTDNLMELADELAVRFGGRKELSVYVNHIFDFDTPMADLHSAKEWEARQSVKYNLEDKLLKHKLLRRGRIQNKIKTNHCMADSGHSVVITPTGDITLCEHYITSEFSGHIDRDELDADMVKSWNERVPEIPECSECAFFPECILLKKCTANSVCYPQRREDCLISLKRNMIFEYELWLNNECIPTHLQTC